VKNLLERHIFYIPLWWKIAELFEPKSAKKRRAKIKL